VAQAAFQDTYDEESDAAQAAPSSYVWCDPVITTEAACQSLADKIGLTWGGANPSWGQSDLVSEGTFPRRTKGCFYWKKGTSRRASFGTGGSLAQMADPPVESWSYRFSEEELSTVGLRCIARAKLSSKRMGLEAPRTLARDSYEA